MYKLVVRNWIWFSAAIVLALLLTFGGTQSPWKDLTFSVNAATLIFAQMGIALLFSRICFENCRLNQLATVAGVAFGCILLLTGVGVAIAQHFSFVAPMKLTLPVVPLVVSSVFGVGAAVALFKIEPLSVYSAGSDQEEESKEEQSESKGAIKLGKTKPKAATSSTKLRGILDKLDAEEEKPQPKPEPPKAPIPDPEEERRNAASATATRLQAQKRKSTSTFTKLQALSASGTGGHRPEDEQGNQESLKDILDRLDDEPLSIMDEPLTQMESGPLVSQDETVSPEAAVPAAQPPAPAEPSSSSSHMDLGSRLMGAITKNQMPSVDPQDLAKPETKPEPKIGRAHV